MSIMLLLVTLLTVLGPMAPTAMAQDVAGSTDYPDYGETDASKLGTFSAMACGVMVRGTIATGGAIVGIIAPTVAVCAFALLLSLE